MADRPRLLARQAGKRHPQQYTSSTAAGIPGEPEAIPEEDQERIALKARTRFAEERAEQNVRRDSKLWAERLRKVEQRARDKDVDIFRHTAAIRREIMSAEALVEGAA